ncbi:MAG: carboxymuconolactone decarboxylase family protein [Elusimicrobiota bacterium]
MSRMMQELYGPEVAKQVYNRLQELDPELNDIIQKIAYDFFWARPGLNTRDKSLVTVVSLVVLGKEEQTRIHINGFLNAGGDPEALIHVLVQLSGITPPDSVRNGAKALADVLKMRGYLEPQIDSLSALLEKGLNGASVDAIWRQEGLSSRDKNLVQVSASAAIGSPEVSRAAIVQFLNCGGTREDIRSVLIHQIVYCGFPTAMNGFAALLDSQVG